LVRLTGPAVFVAGAGLLCACAASGKVNTGAVDGELLSTLHRQRPGVDVEARCPNAIPSKPGTTFECSVILDGAETLYTVTVSHVAGAKDYLEMEPAAPIFDTQQVAASVRQQVGAAATVNCGSARFVQVPVHGTFRCSVVTGGQTSTLTATVTDSQGGVSFAAGGSGAPGAGTATGPTTTPTLPGGG
jgi:hypothetical protein